MGEALARERKLLRSLPETSFPSAEESLVRVGQKGLVTVRQNHYSVPVRLAGLRVRASVSAREITISHEGTEVARHERLRGRFSVCARLEHYLELLRRKPGALAGSLALHQEREAGRCRSDPRSRRPVVAGPSAVVGRDDLVGLRAAGEFDDDRRPADLDRRLRK